ncbi:hypothetical protein Hanom_Chr06g00537941 [Helianthus anomalus]
MLSICIIWFLEQFSYQPESMVVKVPPRLRVLPEYSLQGRLPRHEYASPRPITPRVISA